MGDLADVLAGVWVAYYADYSAIAIFQTEVEALRWAVANGAYAVAPYRFSQAMSLQDYLTQYEKARCEGTPC